jgi:hypothetical protein
MECERAAEAVKQQLALKDEQLAQKDKQLAHRAATTDARIAELAASAEANVAGLKSAGASAAAALTAHQAASAAATAATDSQVDSLRMCCAVLKDENKVLHGLVNSLDARLGATTAALVAAVARLDKLEYCTRTATTAEQPHVEAPEAPDQGATKTLPDPAAKLHALSVTVPAGRGAGGGTATRGETSDQGTCGEQTVHNGVTGAMTAHGVGAPPPPATPPAAAAAAAAAAVAAVAAAGGEGAEFEACASFSGPRPGFAFNTGPQGTGFYRCVNTAAAASTALAVAAGAGATARAGATPVASPSALPAVTAAAAATTTAAAATITAVPALRSDATTAQKSAHERAFNNALQPLLRTWMDEAPTMNSAVLLVDKAKMLELEKVITTPTGRSELEALVPAVAERIRATALLYAGVVQAQRLLAIVEAGNNLYFGIYHGALDMVRSNDGYDVLCMALDSVSPDTSRFPQRTPDLTAIYEAAHETFPLFGAALVDAVTRAKDSGVTVETRAAPLKHVFRVLQKHATRVDGGAPTEFETACDIVRGSIVCESVHDLSVVLWKLLAMEEEGKIVIVRIKNRFKNPTAAGWADAMLNFVCLGGGDAVAGHVCELQLVHTTMLKARKEFGGHAAYAAFREAAELLEFVVGGIMVNAARGPVAALEALVLEQAVGGAGEGVEATGVEAGGGAESGPGVAFGWACVACTFVNTDPLVLACEMCGAGKPTVAVAEPETVGGGRGGALAVAQQAVDDAIAPLRQVRRLVSDGSDPAAAADALLERVAQADPFTFVEIVCGDLDRSLGKASAVIVECGKRVVRLPGWHNPRDLTSAGGDAVLATSVLSPGRRSVQIGGRKVGSIAVGLAIAHKDISRVEHYKEETRGGLWTICGAGKTLFDSNGCRNSCGGGVLDDDDEILSRVQRMNGEVGYDGGYTHEQNPDWVLELVHDAAKGTLRYEGEGRVLGEHTDVMYEGETAVKLFVCLGDWVGQSVRLLSEGEVPVAVKEQRAELFEAWEAGGREAWNAKKQARDEYNHQKMVKIAEAMPDCSQQ